MRTRELGPVARGKASWYSVLWASTAGTVQDGNVYGKFASKTLLGSARVQDSKSSRSGDIEWRLARLAGKRPNTVLVLSRQVDAHACPCRSGRSMSDSKRSNTRDWCRGESASIWLPRTVERPATPSVCLLVIAETFLCPGLWRSVLGREQYQRELHERVQATHVSVQKDKPTEAQNTEN